MPAGGKLTVETMNAHIDDAYAASNLDAVPGQYVVLAVSDTGAGMEPEVLTSAFEPFYTTKGIGHGTGLGLSQIYGYLKQTGGHAKIYSEHGQGTTVKLYFPRKLGSDEATPPEAESEAPSVSRGSADEVILVVEDEAGVREVAVQSLVDLGYTVREAKDGPTASEAA
jgi:hypothetical protein